MKVNNRVIRALIIACCTLMAPGSYGEDSQELKDEKARTALLEEKKKQAEAIKAIAEAELQKSAVLASEKEKTALMEEMKKQAEAAKAVVDAEDQDTDRLTEEKQQTSILEEQKKQAEAQKSIAAAELAETTAGVTPKSEPLTGSVTGTVKTHVPTLVVHKSLDLIAQDIATSLKSKITGKKLILSNTSNRGVGSLIAIQATTELTYYQTAVTDQIARNDGSLSGDDNFTLHSGFIPAITAGSAAISALADVVGLFKSEYSALEVAISADQATLDAVMAQKLSAEGGQVIDLDQKEWTTSTTVTSYLDLTRSITKLRISVTKLESAIAAQNVTVAEQRTNITNLKAELQKLQDEAAKRAKKLEIKQAEQKVDEVNAEIADKELRKAESAALEESVKTFITGLTAVPDGGRSVFMETVLSEERSKVDFVLESGLVGAGGEGYIDRSLFRSTKLSALAGGFVRYALVDKDGIVVASGLVGRAYAAVYKVRKPGEITIEKVNILLPEQK